MMNKEQIRDLINKRIFCGHRDWLAYEYRPVYRSTDAMKLASILCPHCGTIKNLISEDLNHSDITQADDSLYVGEVHEG